MDSIGRDEKLGRLHRSRLLQTGVVAGVDHGGGVAFYVSEPQGLPAALGAEARDLPRAGMAALLAVGQTPRTIWFHEEGAVGS